MATTGIGEFRLAGTAAGHRENRKLLVDVGAAAVRAVRRGVVARNNLFEWALAVSTDIFENRH